MQVRLIPRRVVFVAAVAILAGVTGVAYATIPDSAGVIHGCYAAPAIQNKDNGGALRVVESAAQCKNSELSVSWNQRGPTGATGAPGPKGDKGADGVGVTATQLTAGDANCPTGGVALAAASEPTYVCNGEQGPEGPATEPSCDDGNSATDDSFANGVCTNRNKPAGARCSPPEDGRADGAGNCVSTAGCEDGNSATDDSLVNGLCVHQNKPVGAACTPPTDGRADGAGSCLSPTTCDDGRTGTDDVIRNGICVHENKPIGAACTPPTDGQADGLGNCVSPAQCDDGRSATDDILRDGACVHQNKPVDAPCSPPAGGRADGAGNCVATASGPSPTVQQLAPSDSHCAAGGAEITDAAGGIAYVCSGENGHDGRDGQPFAGTFTSPNGDYTISVLDTGITISGPNASVIRVTAAEVKIQSGGDVAIKGAAAVNVEAATTLTEKASAVTLEGTGSASIKGAVVNISTPTFIGGESCRPAARAGDLVTGTGLPGSFTGMIVDGKSQVCLG